MLSMFVFYYCCWTLLCDLKTFVEKTVSWTRKTTVYARWGWDASAGEAYSDWAHTYLFLTRLTAYVVKIFCLAHDLTPLDENIICNAVNWLVTSTQEADGKFKEVYQIYSSSMGVSYHTWLYIFVYISGQNNSLKILMKMVSVICLSRFPLKHRFYFYFFVVYLPREVEPRSAM